MMVQFSLGYRFEKYCTSTGVLRHVYSNVKQLFCFSNLRGTRRTKHLRWHTAVCRTHLCLATLHGAQRSTHVEFLSF